MNKRVVKIKKKIERKGLNYDAIEEKKCEIERFGRDKWEEEGEKLIKNRRRWKRGRESEIENWERERIERKIGEFQTKREGRKITNGRLGQVFWRNSTKNNILIYEQTFFVASWACQSFDEAIIPIPPQKTLKRQ